MPLICNSSVILCLFFDGTEMGFERGGVSRNHHLFSSASLIGRQNLDGSVQILSEKI